jgi:hypothetical protein
MNEAALLDIAVAVRDAQRALDDARARVAGLDALVIAAMAAHSPLSAPRAPRDGTQTERVEAFLRMQPGHEASRRDLTRAFPDMADNSLSGALQRLKDRGTVEQPGRGRYRLRRRY